MIFNMVASEIYLVLYNETTIIKYTGVFGIDKMSDNKKSLLISVVPHANICGTW